MKKIKKLLTIMLACLSVACVAGGVTACNQPDSSDKGSFENNETEQTPNEEEEEEKEEQTDVSVYQIKNGNFDLGNLDGWSMEGEAFSPLGLVGEEGQNGYSFGEYAEEEEGALISSAFKVGGSGFITFRLGGGMNEGLTYVSVIDGTTNVELFRFSNQNFDKTESDKLIAYKANLNAAIGKTVKLKIVDNSKANYGYLCFDDFVTYYETEPNEEFVLATDCKPFYLSADATSSFVQNGDFSDGLSGWQTTGEEDCFKVGHIKDGKLSNKKDSDSVGVLRSSSFTVSGLGLISYRLGMTKDPESTYLSVKKSGTNEEIFRTHSNRWKTDHGESTHLYYLDLSAYLGEAVYLEFVDNSREEWGAFSIRGVNTVYTELPMDLTDETAYEVRKSVDTSPKYSVMRSQMSEIIEGIDEETLKKTFQNTFYATLDGFTVKDKTYSGVLRYNDDGTVFCYTGDIHAMWLRDSSAQVLQYLQFMTIDEDVRNTVRGLLLKQFELIRRDPYANAFNADGSVWERKFELDSLMYPLWLAKQYYDITGDQEIFNNFFLVTMERLLTVLENETDHKDSNYKIYDTDLGKGDNYFENCGLIWSGYRPSDDVCHYKFFIPGNMFVVATLEDMVTLFEQTGLDSQMKTRMATFASSVRSAIETYGVYNHPTYGKMYAFEVNGTNADVNSAEGKLLMDAANIPSLISAPWLGYCEVDDPTYLNTRAFTLSDDNPYYYEGTYASGIGDPHDMVGSSADLHKEIPVPWHMSIAMQGLTSMDDAEIITCVEYMTNTTGGTFVMHEAFNANNPNDYSRDYFTWPCSLYAHLVLTKVFNFNLLEV